MERTYSDKSEWPSEKHSEAIMKAPHMEGGLLESMRTMSPSPLIVISGNQGGHAYNVAEPTHRNQWQSRKACVQRRRAHSS